MLVGRQRQILPPLERDLVAKLHQFGIDRPIAAVRELDRELWQRSRVAAEAAGLLQRRLPAPGVDAVPLRRYGIADAGDLNEPMHLWEKAACAGRGLSRAPLTPRSKLDAAKFPGDSTP